MTARNDHVKLIVATIVAVLCLVLSAVRNRPPVPREPGPHQEFSAVQAHKVLESLYSEETIHPTGSVDNRRLKEAILERLGQLGYTPSVQEAFACHEAGSCGHVENILARLEGSGDGPAVLLAVHYDSVGAGPSVSDDGVAVAITLEIARILKAAPPPPNDVILLIDDGEEVALLGAIAFAEEHSWAVEVGAVVNLEARGTAGRSFMFETGSDNAWLVELMAEHLPRPATSSLYYSIYEQLPNDTDFTIFKAHGMNGVNFAFLQNVVHYHTPLDDLEHATLSTIQHHGDNALAMVRALANTDLESPPTGNATWFDVWGFGIVAWPESWNWVLAIASILLVMVAGGIHWRRHDLTAAQTGHGLILWPVAVLGATAIAVVSAWLLRSIGGLPAWPAAAWAPKSASWLIALSVPALTMGWIGRRAGRTATWLGALWWLSILSLAVSVILPGATYIFLIPALAGSLLAALALVVASELLSTLAVGLTVAAACIVQLDLVWSLWDAMGITIMPIVSFFIAMVVFLVLAPSAEQVGRARSKLPVLGMALAAAFLLAAMVIPPYSSESPRALNLYFLQDSDLGTAHLMARKGSRALPEPLRQAAPWAKETETPFTWGSQPGKYWVAEVPPLPVPSPQMVVVSEEEIDRGRNLRARFHSVRGADRGTVVFHDADRVTALRIEGHEIDLQGELISRFHAENQRSVRLATMPGVGIEFELEIKGSEPLELTLLDHSYGVPEAGNHLLEARPDWVVPGWVGDLTMVLKRAAL